ncbi:hypothetical protein G3M48_003203 [Beauveria asiatica]|uniref:Peptide hydrolase n=1 Tax=Beauveria asiatica TaxID=1069075 RepID=A0AAW0RWH3_9HYPO
MTMQVLLEFRPSLVTFWIFLTYVSITSVLVYVQETVPTPPTVLPVGLNLTEAMLDLQTITRAYHPFSSRENDRVRQFLLNRSEHIIGRNGIKYKYEAVRGSNAEEWPRQEIGATNEYMGTEEPDAILFIHEALNFAFSYDAGEYLSGGGTGSTWTAQYFEDNSFCIYIRGKRDLQGDWWHESTAGMFHRLTGGVLLLSYFTSPERQPENGVVLLFNNAEEDGLLGARAFSRSPVLPFLRTFINLEGVGAGGRAMLFQATDVHVARAYSRAPHPFGSIIANDGYDKGFVMSGTDYQIFTGTYNLRGLDIAFYKSRSRYHTTDDDARSTTTASIWHMLSAAITTTERLSHISDHTTTADYHVDTDRVDAGVWFDILGRWFLAFPLRVLFTGSLALLIGTPLLIAFWTLLLFWKENSSILMGDIINSRLPVAVAFAIIFTMGPIFVLIKVNPLIIYGNQYPVWAMSLSSCYIGLWLPMHGSLGDTRLGTFFWFFTLSLVLLVIATVAENKYGIGTFYVVFFLHIAIFLSLILSLIERLALPARLSDAEDATLEDYIPGRAEVSVSELRTTGNGDDEYSEQSGNFDTALDTGQTHTAFTPLLDSSRRRQTITRSCRHFIIFSPSSAKHLVQKWLQSRNNELFPSSLHINTWILQFLLLGPVNIILIGSQGLASVAAIAMTGTDGSNLMTPWLLLGVFSIVFLLPLLPFIHRTSQHIVIFLFIVFAGNILYLGSAFPFSADSRFKFIFQQTINLNDGTNVVTLTGIEKYLRSIVNVIPDAAGAAVCQPAVERNLTDCQYHSQLAPDVANGTELENLIEFTYTAADNT